MLLLYPPHASDAPDCSLLPIPLLMTSCLQTTSNQNVLYIIISDAIKKFVINNHPISALFIQRPFKINHLHNKCTGWALHETRGQRENPYSVCVRSVSNAAAHQPVSSGCCPADTLCCWRRTTDECRDFCDIAALQVKIPGPNFTKYFPWINQPDWRITAVVQSCSSQNVSNM